MNEKILHLSLTEPTAEGAVAGTAGLMELLAA